MKSQCMEHDQIVTNIPCEATLMVRHLDLGINLDQPHTLDIQPLTNLKLTEFLYITLSLSLSGLCHCQDYRPSIFFLPLRVLPTTQSLPSPCCQLVLHSSNSCIRVILREAHSASKEEEGSC